MKTALRLAVLAGVAVFALACAQTDAGITTKVKSKLIADDTVKAYEIDVDTREKVVTLSGNVETEAQKIKADEIARTTEGVADVVNNIVVAGGSMAMPGESSPAGGEGGLAATGESIAGAVDDAAITASVKSKLLADTMVAGLKIDVDTKGGTVTLNGEAKTRAEADQAVRLARETNGVKDVVDNIQVVGGN